MRPDSGLRRNDGMGLGCRLWGRMTVWGWDDGCRMGIPACAGMTVGGLE